MFSMLVVTVLLTMTTMQFLTSLFAVLRAQGFPYSFDEADLWRGERWPCL